MRYKTIMDADGKVIGIAIDEKGNPVVIQEGAGENGADKEIGLDAIHLYTKIPSLQEEAKNHRLKANEYKEFVDALEEAEVDVKDIALFKTWIEDASGAISTVKNLDDKKLIDANEVDQIKKQAVEAHEKKVAELETKFGKKLEAATLTQKELEATIFELMVSNNFAKSAFVKDKLAMTPRVDEAYFKDNFKVEKGDDGKYHVIAYNKGEKLFSEERVGEPPEFDEAVALMVARDPDRDSLIIAPGEGGSGNHGSEHRADGVRNANQNPFVKGPYFNLTTQGEIHRTDPQRATRLMAEAKIANANNAK